MLRGRGGRAGGGAHAQGVRREGHVGAEEPEQQLPLALLPLSQHVPQRQAVSHPAGQHLAVGGAGQRHGWQRAGAAQRHLLRQTAGGQEWGVGSRGGRPRGCGPGWARRQGLTWRAGGCPASSWRAASGIGRCCLSAPSSTGCPRGRRAATQASWGRAQGMGSGTTARPALSVPWLWGPTWHLCSILNRPSLSLLVCPPPRVTPKSVLEARLLLLTGW